METVEDLEVHQGVILADAMAIEDVLEAVNVTILGAGLLQEDHVRDGDDDGDVISSIS